MRRDELRDLLIRTGRELLAEEGLSRGTEHVTFKRVFERVRREAGVRVTNGSVIGRIWDSMEEYQSAVLESALRDDAHRAIDQTITVAADVVAAADLSTLAGRRAAASELVRVAGAVNAEALARSRQESVYLGVRGIAVSRLPVDPESPVSKRVCAAYEEYGRRFDLAFESALGSLGARVRPEFRVRQLSMAAVALAEGCTIWDRVDPANTRSIRRPSGPDGAEQEWTLFAVGVAALVDLFTEWIDPWSPGAATSAPASGTG